MTMRRVILADIDTAERRALTTRSAVPDASVRTAAAAIVETVRSGGDTALLEANGRYGGGPSNGSIRVAASSIRSAADALSPTLRDAIETAAANIRSVHEPQRPVDSRIESTPGVVVERRWSPVRRVGVYVPGGRAAYPSSVLMGVIPALVAGVDEIVVVSPGGEDGAVQPLVLAAAGMLGVEEIYATGGAQAIGALAYGTGTIRPADLIVGPGGPWVTAAKLAVYGTCGVDLPAGPSEALILIDDTTDPAIAAADMLCQAEHGPDSPVAVVSTDEAALDAVLAEVDRQLTDLPRAALVRSSLDDYGLAVLAPDIDQAVVFADAWAPEHLTIQTADAARDASRIPSAGSVFVGRWTPESAGDYATGANHVLPTGGLARSSGPLSVEDFGSWRQVQQLTRAGLEAIAPTIRTLAAAEGLDAHARCVDARFGTAP